MPRPCLKSAAVFASHRPADPCSPPKTRVLGGVPAVQRHPAVASSKPTGPCPISQVKGFGGAGGLFPKKPPCNALPPPQAEHIGAAQKNAPPREAKQNVPASRRRSTMPRPCLKSAAVFASHRPADPCSPPKTRVLGGVPAVQRHPAVASSKPTGPCPISQVKGLGGAGGLFPKKPPCNALPYPRTMSNAQILVSISSLRRAMIFFSRREM